MALHIHIHTHTHTHIKFLILAQSSEQDGGSVGGEQSKQCVKCVGVCINMYLLLSQHLLYAASLDSRHSLGFFLDLLHCSCEQAKVCATPALPPPLSFSSLSCVPTSHT